MSDPTGREFTLSEIQSIWEQQQTRLRALSADRVREYAELEYGVGIADGYRPELRLGPEGIELHAVPDDERKASNG
jgi:hypothetical protein